jgi:hypothetical protein
VVVPRHVQRLHADLVQSQAPEDAAVVRARRALQFLCEAVERAEARLERQRNSGLGKRRKLGQIAAEAHLGRARHDTVPDLLRNHAAAETPDVRGNCGIGLQRLHLTTSLTRRFERE